MDSIQTLKNIKTLANKTMTNKFEHLGVSDEDIIKIINQEKTTIDEHDYRTIWQFNQGVEFILTQNHQMTFDDILFLHSIIGKKLALNAGEFAFSKRVVSGETDDEFFEISPISETQVREEFENLLIKICSCPQSEIIEILCEWFVKQITGQWFYDCNKRTAFLTLNRLLIENNTNKMLLDFDSEKFDKFLTNCYRTKNFTDMAILLKNSLTSINFDKIENFVLTKDFFVRKKSQKIF